MQRFVGWLRNFDEHRLLVNAALVHGVQDQAVKMSVEDCRCAKALDQRDRAVIAFVGLETDLPHWVVCDQAGAVSQAW